jgi:hypothetical protein
MDAIVPAEIGTPSAFAENESFTRRRPHDRKPRVPDSPSQNGVVTIPPWRVRPVSFGDGCLEGAVQIEPHVREDIVLLDASPAA